MKTNIVLTLLVVATCAAPAFAKKGQATSTLAQMDADKDGKVSKAEYVGGRQKKGKRIWSAKFDALDVNKDGFIDASEFYN